MSTKRHSVSLPRVDTGGRLAPSSAGLKEPRPARAWLSLDGRADRAEDARHLGAEEDQRDDRDDGDEGEDQRVLREALAFLVTTNKIDECGEELHWRGTSFPERSPLLDDSAPGSGVGAAPYRGSRRYVNQSGWARPSTSPWPAGPPPGRAKEPVPPRSARRTCRRCSGSPRPGNPGRSGR